MRAAKAREAASVRIKIRVRTQPKVRARANGRNEPGAHARSAVVSTHLLRLLDEHLFSTIVVAMQQLLLHRTTTRIAMI